MQRKKKINNNSLINRDVDVLIYTHVPNVKGDFKFLAVSPVIQGDPSVAKVIKSIVRILLIKITVDDYVKINKLNKHDINY